MLIGLRARGAAAERAAATVRPGVVALLCGSYVASAVTVGAIDNARVSAVVPAAGFTLVLAALAVRGHPAQRDALVAR
jgi:hypothetical protein